MMKTATAMNVNIIFIEVPGKGSCGNGGTTVIIQISPVSSW